MRPAPEGDDARTMLRNAIEAELRGGFAGPDEAVDAAVDPVADEISDRIGDLDDDEAEALDPVDRGDPDALRAEGRRIARDVVRALRAEAAGWPARTDCDRLDAAFADLDAAGIVARQNFSCCGNCAHVEIGDEIRAAAEAGRRPRGYAFYHVQDTESAVTDGGFHIGYGPADSAGDVGLDRAASAAVAREVVETLRRHGFAPTWDGDPDRRIHVALDWRRRGPWFGGAGAAADDASGDEEFEDASDDASEEGPVEPPQIPAPAVPRRRKDLASDPTRAPFRFSSDELGALFVGHGPWAGLWMLSARDATAGLLVACVGSVAAVLLLREILLRDLRLGTRLARAGDWATAEPFLARALDGFRRRRWTDRLRGALFCDLGDVGLAERAAALLAHARMRIDDADGAAAALADGLDVAPRSRFLAGVAATLDLDPRA